MKEGKVCKMDSSGLPPWEALVMIAGSLNFPILSYGSRIATEEAESSMGVYLLGGPFRQAVSIQGMEGENSKTAWVSTFLVDHSGRRPLSRSLMQWV